jgi:hypothetical protein
MVPAWFLRSSPVLTAIGLTSSDKAIDANGESTGKPVIAVRAECFPSLGNMAEFRILCTNGNRLGHSRNGILNSEHRARKSRSFSRLTTSAVPLLQGEYATVNREAQRFCSFRILTTSFLKCEPLSLTQSRQTPNVEKQSVRARAVVSASAARAKKSRT